DGSLSGTEMRGTSNTFVVRPAGFVITQIETLAGTANPGTTTAGLGFVPAGSPFRVLLEARNALGNITPNFGREIIPEQLGLVVGNLQFPAGGNPGTLLNATAFSATANSG